MKPKVFLPAALALLALTACTAGAAVPSPSIPEPTAAPSPAEAAEEHLEFYDEFERYNNSVDEHDFVLSEARVNSQLQYRLENAEHGVTVTVPAGDKESEPPAATIFYQGRSLEFEMPVFLLGHGTVSGTASLHLADLTGDGTPELVYIYGWGGTGVWEDHVKVFDLSVMTECPVTWDNTLLEESVGLRAVELRKDDNNDQTAVFEITGPDGQAVYGAAGYEGEALPERVTTLFGFHESIALTEGGLTLTSAFAPDLDIPSPLHLGSLTGAFAYDPQTSSFSLQSPYAMEVYEQTEF